MIRIQNILAPVDFSTASRTAMRYAAALAVRFGARLTAAHIVPPLSTFNYELQGDIGPVEREMFENARRRVPAEIPQAVRDRIQTRTVVKGGDVRDELLGVVTDEAVDLVVMGTHGRRGVERFFLGSTTENILRRVPVPILTVSERGSQAHAESPFEPPFRRILYATDLSETGVAGLHYCGRFAGALEARVTALHVVDLRDAMTFDRGELRGAAVQRLSAAIAQFGAPDFGPVSCAVAEGTPHQEILAGAERIHADLIVLNLQSHGFFDRALLGSTAERVIRSASIPVLSIPVPEAPVLRPAPAADAAMLHAV